MWLLDPLNPLGPNFNEELYIKVQAEAAIQMAKNFGTL
jgi:hypothetical protein